MRQLIYTLFNTNHQTSFHLWCKKISWSNKTSQNIMSTVVFNVFLCVYQQVQFLKRIIFWLGFTLSFAKYIVDQTWKPFNSELGPQWKDQKKSFDSFFWSFHWGPNFSTFLAQNWGVFCYLLALDLGWICVKGLIVTKIVEKNKFKRAWNQLEAKKLFLATSMDKILETSSSFHVIHRTMGKF